MEWQYATVHSTVTTICSALREHLYVHVHTCTCALYK